MIHIQLVAYCFHSEIMFYILFFQTLKSLLWTGNDKENAGAALGGECGGLGADSTGVRPLLRRHPGTPLSTLQFLSQSSGLLKFIYSFGGIIAHNHICGSAFSVYGFGSRTLTIYGSSFGRVDKNTDPAGSGSICRRVFFFFSWKRKSYEGAKSEKKFKKVHKNIHTISDCDHFLRCWIQYRK